MTFSCGGYCWHAPGATPAWVADSCDDEAIEELVHVGPRDDEVASGYTVVPVTLLPAYDPEAEE
ncbi:hypothetical protein ABZ958_37225 [Streptomyces sp. NPDC046237]|uniref:hypothetical protein n=1 Tax=Streptomyces sp. NPDC046237 TaxID=3154914 RepID=UPI0033C955B1